MLFMTNSRSCVAVFVSAAPAVMQQPAAVVRLCFIDLKMGNSFLRLSSVTNIRENEHVI